MFEKKVKNKIVKISQCLHKYLFGNEAGERTIKFAKNITLSFSGGMVAFVILFIASVVTARVVGPAEYGKYAVVFSLAQMLSLFFVLELDVSALYFLAKDSDKKDRIVSSIVVMFFINIIVFIFLAIGLYQFIAPEDISRLAFVGVIAMALTFAFKRIVDVFLRVEGKFKAQALFKILEALTVVGVLGVAFWLANQKTYYSYVVAIIAGGSIFTIFGIMLSRSMLSVRNVTTECMDMVFKYNIFGIIGAIVNSIIKNIDKIIVVVFLGTAVGGVYAVYFTASVIIGARVTQLFINVFFPAVRANSNNLKSIFTKVNVLFVKAFIPLIFVASTGVLLVIILYGPQYPLVWFWVILSGIYIAVHFFASLYGWLLSSISRDGYKKYNLSFVYGLVVYGAFMWIVFLNDLFSITALLLALIIYRVVGGFVSFMELKKFVS